MLVDWFTVAAQTLNFLILVFLMWRFLYKPILHAIDERERHIAAELADADAQRVEAHKERDEYQHKNEEFAEQSAALLRQARDEASVERERLLGDARQTADALSSKRRKTLEDDAQNLSQAIGNRAQNEVFAIARKVLTELAGVSLEERVCEAFTRRLREMESPTRATLAQALRMDSEPALVRSTFDLPAEQRAAVQNAINETFSADIRLRFETAPNLVSGIELTTNGLTVGWSIAEYLTSLEAGVGELLGGKDRPDAKRAVSAGAKAEPTPKEATLGTDRL